MKFILKRVPLIRNIQNYAKVDLISDLIAGVTLSLTMIPQSIAYAALAGLPPQFGLNSTFIGCFVYAIFGTIKEISIGPTSLMSLLTFEYTRDLTPDFVVFLTFVSGFVVCLMGLFNLGFLVNFISTPVTSGFTSATAIIIIVSQLKGLLGVRFKSCGFLDNIFELIVHASETQLTGDFALGVFCVITLLLLRKLKDIELHRKIPGNKRLRKILWFISIGRNAVVVLICCCVASWFENNEQKMPFILSGSGTSGIPPFKLPPFDVKLGNETLTTMQMAEELGSAIFIVPIVAVLANIAIAKAFSTGEVFDATQEMLTLSVCNLLGSCFGSMPTCGAFTRSAVSNASGVRTPIAGIFSGCLSLLALNFLSPYFHLIPRATLSAVLICAVVFLIDWQIILPLWRTNKKELVVLVITLLTCLCFGVEIGLLIGVAINLAHLLYLWAQPSIAKEYCKGCGGEYVVLTPDKGLFFPAVDKLQTSIIKVNKERGKSLIPIVIDCTHFTGLDYTAAKTLITLVKQLKENSQPLVFLNINQEMITFCCKIGCEKVVFCESGNDLDRLLFGDLMTTVRPTPIPIATEIDECKSFKMERSKSRENIPLLDRTDKTPNVLRK